jgi:hypothetical protein
MPAARSVSTIGAVAVATAIAATFAGGVGALAVAKSTAVKACETKHGFLAAAKKNKCPKGSHTLKLGVKGPAGPRGTRGAKGDAGTNGLSQVFVGGTIASAGPLSDVAYTDVLAVANVPAGSYTVSYHYEAHDSTATGEVPVQCEPDSPASTLADLRSIDVPGGQTGQVAGTFTITVSSSGPIEVRCDIDTGASVSGVSGDIVATAVNSVTTSLPTG